MSPPTLTNCVIDGTLRRAGGRALAFVGWGDLHAFAVLGHRAPRDGYALSGQNFRELAVAPWVLGILLGNQFLDLGANGGRGHLGTVRRLDVAGEEIAELEDAARGMHVLGRRDARDGSPRHP